MLESLRGAATDPRFWAALVVAALSGLGGVLTWKAARGTGRELLTGLRWLFAHGELCREILAALEGADRHSERIVANKDAGLAVKVQGKPVVVMIRGADVWDLLSRRERRAVLARARAVHARLQAQERSRQRDDFASMLRRGPDEEILPILDRDPDPEDASASVELAITFDDPEPQARAEPATLIKMPASPAHPTIPPLYASTPHPRHP